MATMGIAAFFYPGAHESAELLHNRPSPASGHPSRSGHTGRRSRFDLFNGNLSVSRSIHLKARFFKKRRCDLQIQFVILDYQKLLSSKIRSF